MKWFYAVIVFLLFLEVVNIRRSIDSIAKSYTLWSASLVMDGYDSLQSFSDKLLGLTATEETAIKEKMNANEDQ